LRDERDAHHDVGQHQHDIVLVLEGRRYAGGEDEHAAHLNDGQQSVEQVVGVELVVQLDGSAMWVHS
jgi:hypothetical protein